MASCSQCKETINTKAKTCPHCGYQPGVDLVAHAKKELGWGILATCSIIGSIIGIPLLFAGLWNYRKGKRLSPVE